MAYYKPGTLAEYHNSGRILAEESEYHRKVEQENTSIAREQQELPPIQSDDILSR